MKKVRRVLSILLSVLIITLTMFTMSAVSFSADNSIGGTLGEKINWSLKDGVLTVNGTGRIEPLIRQVEKEVYNDDQITTQTVDIPYFPWVEAVENALFSKYGVKDFNEAYLKVMSGLIDDRAFILDEIGMVKKVVIGEGITDIAPEAFWGHGVSPQIIILPSTLETVGRGAFNLQMLTEMVIRNPAFDYATNQVKMYGFIGERFFESFDEQLYIMLQLQDISTFYSAISDAVHLAWQCSKTEKESSASIAAINASDQSEAEKVAAIDAINQRITKSLEFIKENYFYLDAASLTDAIAELIEVVNRFLGASYTSLDELVIEAGDNGLVYCETIQEALSAAEAEGEEIEASLDSSEPYNLGEEPKVKHTFFDAETGEKEEITFILIPAPWLTVYGEKDSTTQTACATSKVKFMSFDEAKAAFEAKKAESIAACDAMAKDGDSDTCKTLINNAKNSIAGLIYDESKTLGENNAVIDAIVVKLATDLAAQREADKPAEGPTPEKPSGDSKKDEVGGYSNNAFMKFIRKIIDFFKNLFSKIFK